MSGATAVEAPRSPAPLSAFGGGGEAGDESTPAGRVGLAVAEPLGRPGAPSPGGRSPAGCCRRPHRRTSAPHRWPSVSVAADVPPVTEAVGRIPEGDLAPLDLGAVRCPFEDAPAQPGLQDDHRVGITRGRVPRGHQVEKRDVHTSKACSAGQRDLVAQASAVRSPSRSGPSDGGRRSGVLGQQTESGGGVAPHLGEIGLHRLDALPVEAVEPTRPLGLLDHQSGFLQQAADGGRRPVD